MRLQAGRRHISVCLASPGHKHMWDGSSQQALGTLHNYQRYLSTCTHHSAYSDSKLNDHLFHNLTFTLILIPIGMLNCRTNIILQI